MILRSVVNATAPKSPTWTSTCVRENGAVSARVVPSVRTYAIKSARRRGCIVSLITTNNALTWLITTPKTKRNLRNTAASSRKNTLTTTKSTQGKEKMLGSYNAAEHLKTQVKKVNL